MTKKLDHSGLMARLRDCEDSALGGALLGNPEYAAIYPLVRQRVVATNLASVTTATVGNNASRMAKLRGVGNILRNEGLSSSRLDVQAPLTLAMLSYSTSRLFRLPEGWPDAYAEPFFDATEAAGGQGVLFEVPALGEYRKPRIRQSHLLGIDELRTRLAARLCPRSAPAKKEIAGFIELWRAAGLQTGMLEGDNWTRIWNHFDYRRARFFEKFIQLRPEICIVVTWYGTTGLAFTAAAQQAGIPVADLQHGVQGPAHGMYGCWSEKVLNSLLIPSAFFNWGVEETTHLQSWIGDNRRTYVCGRPWLHMNQDLLTTSPDYLSLKKEAANRPVLLVSLQPNPLALLELVESALTQPGADRFAWALRCHPGQLGQVDTIAKRFSQQKAVLPVRAATLAPLGLLLGLSAAHLTEFSSVILEAEAAGVPSFLSSEFAFAQYPSLDTEKILVTPNAATLLSALNTVSARRTTLQKSESTPKTALHAFKKDAQAGVFDFLNRPPDH